MDDLITEVPNIYKNFLVAFKLTTIKILFNCHGLFGKSGTIVLKNRKY